MVFRTFALSVVVTIVSLVVAFLYGGPEAFILCLILGVLEISLSFDNAVVNARVLERMSDFWQQIFLTIGILIAVFGMRLVFPLLVVGVTAQLGPIEAVQLALQQGDPEEPGSYGYILNQAGPQIEAFGGMFLAMLFLDFIFEDRDIKWLRWLESPLATIGKLPQLSVIVAGAALVLVATFLAEDPAIVLIAGVLGMITYIAVNGLGQLFNVENVIDEQEVGAQEGASGPSASSGQTGPAVPATATGPSGLAKATGKAGFFLFLYLEVLDASFSFDGVIGAFAITTDPIIIALGLGFIGAIFVRSITIYLVRAGTLAEYVYLDHGAHWAIGALATILLLSIGFHINEILTGLVGVAFIGAALISSLRRNRRIRAETGSAEATQLSV